MFLELFVMVTHKGGEWVSPTGTCYSGRWHDSLLPLPDSYSSGGLNVAQYADPGAPALPEVYTMPGDNLCVYLFGAGYHMAGQSEGSAIGCSDAFLMQVCSDLGIDPYSIPQAASEEEAADPEGTTILCLNQPIMATQGDGGGGGLGRASTKSAPSISPAQTQTPSASPSGLQNPPGNLPYADCEEYRLYGNPGDRLMASLNRRTACFDALYTVSEIKVKNIGPVPYLVVGMANYMIDYSLTIDPSSKYGFSMSGLFRLVYESPYWDAVGHDLSFYPCELYCTDSESSWSTIGGSSWGGSMTAHFNATTPAPGTSDWVPLGGAEVVMDASSAVVGHYQMHLPLVPWRCDGVGVFVGISTRACVFPWAAGLMTYSSATMPTIAYHIAQAQMSGLPGGVNSGTYLHRVVDTTAMNANRNMSCPSSLSRPSELYSCDEYPFASTYEGAASTSGGPRSWDGCYMPDDPDYGPNGFSRCFVPVLEQNIQGGTMSAMYARDQILDGEPYQVVIA